MSVEKLHAYPTEEWDRNEYLNPVEAGLVGPYGTEPDLSFLHDPDFMRLSPDERIVNHWYDVGTLYAPQVVVTFGGIHTYNPHDMLAITAPNAWRRFGDYTVNRDRVSIVEGRVRFIDPSKSDTQIIQEDGEAGLIEACARREGVHVVDAEPGAVGLRMLARTYGGGPVIDYLTLRMVHGWHKLSNESRPSLKTYIIDTLRRVSYLLDFPEFDSSNFSNNVERLAPGLSNDELLFAEFGLDQTTHEPIIARYTPAERTMMQELALNYNLQRDRKLMSVTNFYIQRGWSVFVEGGDVHMRAIDPFLRGIERTYAKARANPPPLSSPYRVY